MTSNGSFNRWEVLVAKGGKSREGIRVDHQHAGTRQRRTEFQHVIDRVKEAGYQAHVTRGEERTIVAAAGSGGRCRELEVFAAAPGVDGAVAIAQLLQTGGSSGEAVFASVVNIGGVQIGDGNFVVIAAHVPLNQGSKWFRPLVQ